VCERARGKLACARGQPGGPVSRRRPRAGRVAAGALPLRRRVPAPPAAAAAGIAYIHIYIYIHIYRCRTYTYIHTYIHTYIGIAYIQIYMPQAPKGADGNGLFRRFEQTDDTGIYLDAAADTKRRTGREGGQEVV
jgi:hypothetical protein